jgi:hypothetical protein
VTEDVSARMFTLGGEGYTLQGGQPFLHFFVFWNGFLTLFQPTHAQI